MTNLRAVARQVARVSLLLVMCVPAAADIAVRAKSLDIEYWLALDSDAADVSLQRLTLMPSARVSLSKHWQMDGQLRIELSDADTGLGSRSTYDAVSKPWQFGNQGRAEIDKATLTWRKGASMLTLGKQSIAWGVLDGLQVTDRFDAVRLRDAFLVDPRPQRLTRWGARWRFSRHGYRVDAALALDGTVSQTATPGDVFFPRAPRLRGGLPNGAPLPKLVVEVPDAPTAGLRVSRTIGYGDLSVLWLRGPDTDPQFAPSPAGVALQYPNRSLYGATWEQASGSRVWRLEVAYVPDQPVNLQATPLLQGETRRRLLAGAGLDWKSRSGFFVNAQLGIDQLESGDVPATRPDRDVITTLRVHKNIANDSLRFSIEWLASLTDGDNVLRPGVSWQYDDRLRLAAGIDYVEGARHGLFGQFEDASRVWLKATLTL